MCFVHYISIPRVKGYNPHNPVIPQLEIHKRRFKKSFSTRVTQRFHRENEQFLSCLKNPTTHINKLITQISTAVISQNRQYIASILREIEYCGQQGIALRGHFDDGPLFDEASSNRGNF